MQKVLQKQAALGALNAASRIERVEMMRQGVPAALLTLLSEEMEISREKLYATIGMSRATADRKVKAQRLLSSSESERALGMAQLVGQVQEIVRQSGDSERFSAARWVADWLDRPHPALGGRRPGALMDTAEGRGLVSDLVAQMQSGAYA
ncbi:MAG: antitoxin Xre/MbcA/ParS toxin-binding domain-containing protein [Gemmatimonadaceae bacterium]